MINIKKRREQRRFLILLLCIFFLVVSFFLISATVNNHNNKKLPGYDETVTEMPIKFSFEEGRNLANEVKEMSQKYTDAKAWLKIPGTSIDSIIFQTDNNDKYLRTDRDNYQTRWGENFLDYRCDLSKINESMQNIIIYGHNTEIDTRFTPLLNYTDLDFYNKHQFIELATGEKNYRFQIFSAYKTTTDFYYIDTSFKDINDYENFVNSIKEKSQINTNISVSKDDTILTLSTCNYEVDNGRFVVHAKLIKE